MNWFWGFILIAITSCVTNAVGSLDKDQIRVELASNLCCRQDGEQTFRNRLEGYLCKRIGAVFTLSDTCFLKAKLIG